MLAHPIKLQWNAVNFVIVQKLTARTSGISKEMKNKTMVTVKMK